MRDEKNTGKITAEICEARRGEKMCEKFILHSQEGYCRSGLSSLQLFFLFFGKATSKHISELEMNNYMPSTILFIIYNI
jgi:hypothetical protein